VDNGKGRIKTPALQKIRAFKVSEKRLLLSTQNHAVKALPLLMLMA